jgi:predicted permease
MVSPGYFEAMRIPLKAGRALAESDGVGGARNILVNEALARKYFGGAAAVGQRIRRDDESSVWHTVVGVVGDVRQHGLSQEPSPEMYYSHRDSLGPARGEFVFVVRSAVPPATLLAGARAAVQEVAPDQPVFQALTMEEVIADSLADRRLNLWLLGVFAAVALVLSAAGLYGVISYLVAQRSREIGIRMALGAQTGDVTRLVMRQGAGLTALGVGVGVLGALALTRLLASMLYGVSTRDPLTFAGVAAVLATVALAATYVPARRAARVNPLRAIRAE